MRQKNAGIQLEVSFVTARRDFKEKTTLAKVRFGDRAFSAAGPRCWNNLPAALRAADSIDSFKTGLKTYLFSNAYSAVS